jgi:hypothetical protein
MLVGDGVGVEGVKVPPAIVMPLIYPLVGPTLPPVATAIILVLLVAVWKYTVFPVPAFP